MKFGICSERFLLVRGKHHFEIVNGNTYIISDLTINIEMISPVELYMR